VRIISVAAGALFNAERHVLLAQRPPGKPMAGLWEFPGGKIEPHETPEAALVRELAEELGVTIKDPRPLDFVSHAYPDFHLVMLLFAVHHWSGTPLGQQGQRLVWTAPQALSGLAMPAADYPLIPAIMRHNISDG
jgi:8-oxo-dGTP diphosphatase